MEISDLLLVNGRIATQDERQSFVTALAIKDGRVHATGDAKSVMARKSPAPPGVETNGPPVIPRLLDSHPHPIPGGLPHNHPPRRDGLPPLPHPTRLPRQPAKHPPP